MKLCLFSFKFLCDHLKLNETKNPYGFKLYRHALYFIRIASPLSPYVGHCGKEIVFSFFQPILN